MPFEPRTIYLLPYIYTSRSKGEAVGLKKRVLFVCTRNSCRSQMAEGLLRFRYGGQYDAFSAGIAPSRVNPWAIRVMRELGVDISGQISKHLDDFLGDEFDVVVTTCDRAKQLCPVFPGAKETVHRGFEDPAAAAGSSERILSPSSAASGTRSTSGSRRRSERPVVLDRIRSSSQTGRAGSSRPVRLPDPRTPTASDRTPPVPHPQGAPRRCRSPFLLAADCVSR